MGSVWEETSEALSGSGILGEWVVDRVLGMVGLGKSEDLRLNFFVLGRVRKTSMKVRSGTISTRKKQVNECHAGTRILHQPITSSNRNTSTSTTIKVHPFPSHSTNKLKNTRVMYMCRRKGKETRYTRQRNSKEV